LFFALSDQEEVIFRGDEDTVGINQAMMRAEMYNSMASICQDA